MAAFRSGDLTLGYDDVGRAAEPGRTVALIHGFASNRWEAWGRVGWLSAFERAGWRAVALDLRGHGESDKPHDPALYARDLMAGDVAALMDELGLGRAHLFGYSMGAHLAMAVALAAPGRVERLALGGVGGRMLAEPPVAPGAMTLAEALTLADPEAIPDPLHRGFRRFAELQGEDLEALAACARGGGRPADPSRISAPTLVAAGALDTLAGDPGGLAAVIPGARAVTIPGCDHFSAIPHPLFKAAVLDFLGGWDEDAVPAFE